MHHAYRHLNHAYGRIALTVHQTESQADNEAATARRMRSVWESTGKALHLGVVTFGKERSTSSA